MKKEDIPEYARQTLTKHLHEPGGILYSSHQTLKKGDVYLLGFNPGGSDGDKTIEDSIDSLLTNTENAYLEQEWENGKGEGKSKLQVRVNALLTALGQNTRDVFATNLIFEQSRNAQGVRFSDAEDYWPINEAFLSIVQPRLILCFGNGAVSPYAFLRSKLKSDDTQEYIAESGHGNWKVRGFECELNGVPTYVAGIPHMSRYYPQNKVKVINWLKKELDNSLYHLVLPEHRTKFQNMKFINIES